MQKKLSELYLKIKKVFSRRLTLMVVPHSTVRSFRVHFTFSFAVFLFLFWTGVTSWATWAVISNIDYWNMKVNHQILKFKVQYFAAELKKSREFVDQLREADVQLRKLLQMKNRRMILEAQDEKSGQGGAESFERSVLQKELSKRIWEISDSEIHDLSQVLLKESMERLESYKEISEYIADERRLYRCTPRGWPTVGRTTSYFGQRISPFRGVPQFHTGIDIANEQGTPVYVTGDGFVELAGWEGGYGRLVIVSHGFGYITYYGHNSAILVKVGERVKRGQVIAYMGDSGSSTGNHVHYEVWSNGRPINPWKYLIANSVEELRTQWTR